MENSSRLTFAGRTPGEWLSSLPTVIILLLAVFLSSGEIIHSQLLKYGENNWEGYFSLRAGAVEPTCNMDRDIDAEVARTVEKRQAEAANDPLGDILGSEINEDAIRRSIERSISNCENRWANYESIQERITPGVTAFSSVETSVAFTVTELGGYKRLLLCLLLLICAATTTIGKHHISLRPIQTLKDHYVSTGGQLIANLMLLTSAVVYRNQELSSLAEGIQVQHLYLHPFWIAGFALLSFINIMQLIKPGKNFREGGNWGKAILTIPLFTFMCLNAGFLFFSQGYYHGISVYLNMMMELSTLFLNLALYIWIGMMLKQTRLAQLVFNVLRPWQMSPELLCFVVLLVTAIPTAYTGASGIFVIAAGAVIYNELIRNGTRPQLALATTAMSGSMGVVLRPCLLVVIIAALNNEVTTAELFSSGIKIFLFTIILFFIYSQFARREPARIAPFQEALPASIKLLKPLIPYFVLITAVVLLFSHGLDRKLDEFSAPIILPVIMLAILLYEYVFTSKNKREENVQAALKDGYERPKGFEHALRVATSETTVHIGALLMLMALSVSVGGVVERVGLMDAIPHDFSSIWVAMIILTITLVLTGMFMDPYGAVILINATIAPFAFQAGIAPLHFWIVALISFELGYLTPPVALNHLLTRQVVGDDVVEQAKPETGSFWYRYEKYLLPIAVLLTALLVVAYLPLAFESLHDWLFQTMSNAPSAADMLETPNLVD